MINTIPDLHRLKNGIRLLTFPLSGTETITALILIKVGSRNEENQFAGISHFLEHLLFKGTKKRPSPIAIAQEIESVGGHFNAFTTKEYTGFYITAAYCHIELVLDILCDILTNSLFDANEVERERGVILEEMRLYFDTPSEYIGELFESLLYGEQPLGKDIVGNFETVRLISRKDFVRYIHQHYIGANIVVTLCGKLSPPAIKKAKTFFEQFHDGKSKGFEGMREAQEKPALLIKDKETNQAHVALGFRTFGISDPSREALDLLATLLGGEKSSRMFVQVRDKLGLAYYISTDANYYADAGYLATFAGVNIDNIDLAIRTILQEYRKVREEGVSQRELLKVKEYIKGRLLIELESSFRMARLISSKELLLERRESLKEYFFRLEAIVPKDIMRLAQRVFQSNRLNLAIIGPFKDQERFLRLLSVPPF